MKILLSFVIGIIIYAALAPFIGVWSLLVAFVVGAMIGSK